MSKVNYRIVPLTTEVAERARQALKGGAPDHALIIATAPNEAPCRHCLRWADPGERVILFPYASLPPGRPYSETGPIFVHAEACKRYERTNEYPAEFRRNRVLRAYNVTNDMIDAEVVPGDGIESVIEKLLQNPETKFLQARSLTRGCYTLTVERA